MNFIRLLPVIISFLLMSAHFYRAGHVALTIICFASLFLLALRKTWVPRLFQLLLIGGALEWLRTLYNFAQVRIAMDQPWTRLVIILGTLALLTALSGLVFKSRALRKRYRPNHYQ